MIWNSTPVYNNRLEILNNGNVGIGTSTPSEPAWKWLGTAQFDGNVGVGTGSPQQSLRRGGRPETFDQGWSQQRLS